MKSKILDACCGSRMFWFDKNNPNVLFIDNRKYSGELCDGRTLDINPDIIADFTQMPFPDNTFYHIVFDPPHLIRIGDNAWMAKKYGKLPTPWQETIRLGFSECWRVLKPNGTLIFKWNEEQVLLSEVLKLAPEPLYGNRRNKTHWIAFFKTE